MASASWDPPTAAERLAADGVALAAGTDCLNLHAGALMDEVEVLRLAARPDLATDACSDALRLYEREGNVVGTMRARAVLQALAGAAP